MVGRRQNKQMAGLEREPSCSNVSQFAVKGIYDLGAPPGICMVKFGNEATVQSGLLRFILTMQIDLDKQGNPQWQS